MRISAGHVCFLSFVWLTHSSCLTAEHTVRELSRLNQRGVCVCLCVSILDQTHLLWVRYCITVFHCSFCVSPCLSVLVLLSDCQRRFFGFIFFFVCFFNTQANDYICSWSYVYNCITVSFKLSLKTHRGNLVHAAFGGILLRRPTEMVELTLNEKSK